jgi:hypothetical protein
VVVIITYFSVVIGEILPKRIALTNPEKIAVRIALPMYLILKICLLGLSNKDRQLKPKTNISLKLNWFYEKL